MTGPVTLPGYRIRTDKKYGLNPWPTSHQVARFCADRHRLWRMQGEPDLLGGVRGVMDR